MEDNTVDMQETREITTIASELKRTQAKQAKKYEELSSLESEIISLKAELIGATERV